MFATNYEKLTSSFFHFCKSLVTGFSSMELSRKTNTHRLFYVSAAAAEASHESGNRWCCYDLLFICFMSFMSFVSFLFFLLKFSSYQSSWPSPLVLILCFHVLSYYETFFFFIVFHSSFYGLKGLTVFFLHCTYFHSADLMGGWVEEKTSWALSYEPFPRINWIHPGTFIVLNLDLWFKLLILNSLYIHLCCKRLHQTHFFLLINWLMRKASHDFS